VHFSFTYTSAPPMDRTACTEPQCLYNGALYLFQFYIVFGKCFIFWRKINKITNENDTPEYFVVNFRNISFVFTINRNLILVGAASVSCLVFSGLMSQSIYEIYLQALLTFLSPSRPDESRLLPHPSTSISGHFTLSSYL